uniref:Uncharacterized protein n=1 Tax=viral metagenome TaxID=1070528 RepID=A0A6C0EV71_9ZZZZ
MSSMSSMSKMSMSTGSSMPDSYVSPRRMGRNARIANKADKEKADKDKSYIPPHLRNKDKEIKEIKNPKINPSDFPELTMTTPIIPTKMDFSKLFEKRRELKKRQYRMKKGWVKLTFNGIIDSLTEEERKEEDLYHTHYIMKANLEKLTCRIENDIEERMEMFPEFEPELLEFSSSSDEASETSEETIVDEDEEVEA